MLTVLLLLWILGPVVVPIVVAAWVADDARRMRNWRRRRDAAAMRLYTRGWKQHAEVERP